MQRNEPSSASVSSSPAHDKQGHASLHSQLGEVDADGWAQFKITGKIKKNSPLYNFLQLFEQQTNDNLDYNVLFTLLKNVKGVIDFGEIMRILQTHEHGMQHVTSQFTGQFALQSEMIENLQKLMKETQRQIAEMRSSFEPTGNMHFSPRNNQTEYKLDDQDNDTFFSDQDLRGEHNQLLQQQLLQQQQQTYAGLQSFPTQPPASPSFPQHLKTSPQPQARPGSAQDHFNNQQPVALPPSGRSSHRSISGNATDQQPISIQMAIHQQLQQQQQQQYLHEQLAQQKKAQEEQAYAARQISTQSHLLSTMPPGTIMYQQRSQSSQGTHNKLPAPVQIPGASRPSSAAGTYNM